MQLEQLNQVQTMTSREIAELTGKAHKNVLADIRKVFSDLGIDRLKFQHIFRDKYGREQTGFSLNKELTFTLLTRYSFQLANIVIKRWLALEEIVTANKIKALEDLNKEQQPMVNFALDFSRSNETYLINDAAKLLDAKPFRLRMLLQNERWLSPSNKPYQRAINTGYMTFKLNGYVYDNEERFSKTPLITAKGLIRLRVLWGARGHLVN